MKHKRAETRGTSSLRSLPRHTTVVLLDIPGMASSGYSFKMGYAQVVMARYQYRKAQHKQVEHKYYVDRKIPNIPSQERR
jgi:hypothetical protein